MRTIWKYEICFNGVTELSMPHFSKIVKFSHFGGGFYIWACLHPEQPPVDRVFRIFGTGHEIPDGFTYLGSTFEGRYVWHLFEDHNTKNLPF